MKSGERVQLLLREYAESLLLAIGLALLVRTFVISAFHIPTSAMEPTLKAGDFILAYRLPFGLKFRETMQIGGRLPARGEVIVFKCPHSPRNSCVKRVIGLPGDRLQIVKKRLFVNGHAADYSAKHREDQNLVFLEKTPFWQSEVMISSENAKGDLQPYIVPPQHVFVLGDMRDASEDSRKWGPVPIKSIEAKVLWVWMSFDWKSQAFQVRSDRIFKSVH